LPVEEIEQEAGKRGDSGPAGANRMLSGNGHIISKADIGWRSGIGRRGTFRLILGQLGRQLGNRGVVDYWQANCTQRLEVAALGGM
jgi:hypothetical protein